MSAGPTLTLYEREGCHLCADMLATLEELFPEAPFALRRVDIDAGDDATLRARYHTEVPVLVAGEHELCRHFLDPVAVRAHLAGYNRG